MGNIQTKESRSGEQQSNSHRSHRSAIAPAFDPSASSSRDDRGSRSRNRSSRNDLGTLLGIGASTSSRTETSYERRETKAEREARKLERERINRIKEREKSLKEEHVDGGYLVTMGVYVGAEDFTKPVVRQLQIERKLAPFWRGLDDFSETWAEHQIVAAARGLPIPPADQTPPDDLISSPLSLQASPSNSSHQLSTLTVPLGPRTLSAASDQSLGSALPSPTSPGATSKSGTGPFKPRTKALAAALSLGSRNGSSNDLTPREINLPNDPYVNGQPLEVFLYKEGAECPICFLYYPPYLNRTRCCDQQICSECFVQIKRPEPHFPDGHDHQGNPETDPEAAELLISEPACCPYCQQPEFGVTYDAPPFRRGLTHHISTAAFASLGPAMSSNSSLGSPSHTPFVPSPPSGTGGRRRTLSLSANDPGVITTDRVRQDWSLKLAAQRNHLARRSAAATALHTAAFLMNDQSPRPFGRMSRFSRRSNGGDRENAPTGNTVVVSSGGNAQAGPQPGARNGTSRGFMQGPQTDRRQTHMENLENMMLAEAIRLSLAVEEDRKRKADKEERKEAKRKEKEERKAAKAAAKGQPYSNQSSASGSTLSLSGLNSIGRRRGNSGASNLRVEATTAHAKTSTGNASPPWGASAATPSHKGKGVDRGSPQTPSEAESGQSNVDPFLQTAAPTSTPAPAPAPTPSAAPRPAPSPIHSAGPSHLRQMSSASSVSSSGPDSRSESYQDASYLQAQDPRSSGLSLGAKTDDSGDEGGRSGDDNEAEPRFNFTSLAEMVGVELEGANAGRRLSQIGESHAEAGSVTVQSSHDDSNKRRSIHKARAEHSEHAEDDSNSYDGDDTLAKSFATLTPEAYGAKMHSDGEEEASGSGNTPHLVITPETPIVDDNEGGQSKQLGFQGTRTVELPGDMVTQ